jgi:copper resistance protein C
MKIVIIIFAVLGLTMATGALGHAGLSESVPAKNAMLMQSPEALSLTFTGEVTLAKVKLSLGDDQAVDFGFAPSADSAKEFSWALPTLKMGNYTVTWNALGHDGHKMSGKFQFMVHGEMSGE